MSISPARTAAFDVLLRVETERAFTAVLLPQYEERLSDRDRGLCHELVLGTLRRQIYLDRVIEHFAGEKRLDAAVRIALRLAIYQVYFLGKVPVHSAVNESVELVRRARKTSAKAFVNAILRRAANEKVSLDLADDLDKLSVETSHPRWLLERWIGEFGIEMTTAIAGASNEAGPNAFRVTGDVSGDQLGNVRRSEFVEGAYIAEKLDRSLIDLGQRGEIYFQDEGSQVVAAAVNIPDGGGFLDICAAPGGKAGLVARRHRRNAVFAGDVYFPRVDLLRENCRKQRAENVHILQYNAEQALPFADGTFDAVLLDAPCSGTGTIRHNPEIRYFLDPSDFGELSGKQLRILKNASKLVKRGGSLVYSTCSLERDENEEVIGRLLDENDDFLLTAPRVPERFVESGTFARTWPFRDGMDGFFIAELRRK